MRQTASTVPKDLSAFDEALGPRRERTYFEALAEKAVSCRGFLSRRRVRRGGVRHGRGLTGAAHGARRDPAHRLRAGGRQCPRHRDRTAGLRLACRRQVGSHVVAFDRVRLGHPRLRGQPGARLRRQQ